MKTRIAILFAVVAALVAASPVSAVPAKPVDATAVTLLPANGTPDELRKMVAAFDKRIAEVNASTETKREQLQKQMKDGLEKAIAKAQSAGDIDAVLALKAAKEKFETMETSDVSIVKNALVFREKKLAEFETTRLADAMKAAKEFNDEMEKAKKDETTKGNFNAAKAIADHQKKLIAWVQTLRKTAVEPRPSQLNQPIAQRPRFQDDPIQQPQAMTHPASILTGTQKEQSVTLSKAGSPYTVKEQYLVPSGSELIVESGVTLLFDKGASLFTEGTLTMEGTESAPITCRGKNAGAETWAGIFVKRSETSLDWVFVTGAKAGLSVTSGKPSISNSIFYKNGNGVRVETAAPTFTNCRMQENGKNGIDCFRTGRDFRIDRCSLVKNKGWGFHGCYYGGGSMTDCDIRNNQGGGIHSDCWSCNVGASGCIIGPNKGLDVENGADIAWDFSGNWWGPQTTRVLQTKGDGANLPNIKDGRDSNGSNIVNVSGFLTAEPKECGATVHFGGIQ